MPSKRFINPYKKNSLEYQTILNNNRIIKNYMFIITENFLSFEKGQQVYKPKQMIKILNSAYQNYYVKISR